MQWHLTLFKETIRKNTSCQHSLSRSWKMYKRHRLLLGVTDVTITGKHERKLYRCLHLVSGNGFFWTGLWTKHHLKPGGIGQLFNMCPWITEPASYTAEITCFTKPGTLFCHTLDRTSLPSCTEASCERIRWRHSSMWTESEFLIWAEMFCSFFFLVYLCLSVCSFGFFSSL